MSAPAESFPADVEMAKPLERAAAQLWRDFLAAQTSPDPGTCLAATRRLVWALAADALPGDIVPELIRDRLPDVADTMARCIARADEGADKLLPAELRHEFALMLWQQQAVLPGNTLRRALQQEFQALRRFRRLAQPVKAARSHHLIGLMLRAMSYRARIHDHERAIRHLERARRGFLSEDRTDLAAEAAFSAIRCWAERRIGDLRENFAVSRHCWQQARAGFAANGQTLRWLAADIEFARALSNRRFLAAKAANEIVDLLGSVLDRIGDRDADPGGGLPDGERRLLIEACSLLGIAHQRRRRMDTRLRGRIRHCLDHANALLTAADPPDMVAAHRLRLAAFLVEELRQARLTVPDAAPAVLAAHQAAAATHDADMRMAADHLTGLLLAEAGQDRRALATFEAVAAARIRLAGEAGNPFGRESSGLVAGGLAVAGALAALRLDGPLAAVQFFEQARLGLGRHGEPRPVTIDRLARACPEGGAIVWLLPDRQRGQAVLALKRDRELALVSLPLPSADDRRMRGALAGWLRAIGQAGQADDDTAIAAMKPALEHVLSQLGRTVSRRLDRFLRAVGVAEEAELVFISTGILSLLPLHAAPVGGARVLIDRYVVRTASRLADLLGPDRRTAHETRRPLVLGDPAGLGLAGFTEAARLKRLFRAAGAAVPRSVTALSSATEAVRLLEGASLIHVAAHGEFGFTDPLWSRIIIGDRQIAPITLLSRADLRGCELVFLCSCGSGLADAGTRADLLTGTANAFLEAGAATVIGTLWPVDNAPASAVAEEFYRAYLAGLPPAAALRAAARAVRPDHPHPFDWAPFVVAGSSAPSSANPARNEQFPANDGFGRQAHALLGQLESEHELPPPSSTD